MRLGVSQAKLRMIIDQHFRRNRAFTARNLCIRGLISVELHIGAGNGLIPVARNRLNCEEILRRGLWYSVDHRVEHERSYSGYRIGISWRQWVNRTGEGRDNAGQREDAGARPWEWDKTGVFRHHALKTRTHHDVRTARVGEVSVNGGMRGDVRF